MKQLLYLSLSLLLISCADNSEKTQFSILPSPDSLQVFVNDGLPTEHVNSFYLDESIEFPEIGLPLKLKRTKIRQDAQIFLALDDEFDLKKEGYHIRLEHSRITIKANDEAGLLYGFVTVQQMIEDAKAQGRPLPLGVVVDGPKLAYRAIHLDVKHHLEKKEYYYQMMDKLARSKVNAIIIEIEDKIAFESQPMVGSEDAWSIAEWRKLSDYAMARNIEISPLVQGLGHASFILKHDQYKLHRDDPKSDWAFNPLDPDYYDLQFDLYRDAMKAFPHGRYLHIGGDEVHTTGRGSGRSALDLQLEWLAKVSDFAEKNGRTPIFWDDMPLQHAGVYGPMFNTNMSKAVVDSIWDVNGSKLGEFLDQFPKNCIYMRWNYSSPQAYGNDRAMQWFTDNGLKVMGATAGQTRWVLMPQNESNIDNIRHFALSSIDKNINGLLLTLWDDDSPHFELYWRGIQAFAEFTWAGDRRTKEEFKKAFRQRTYGWRAADSTFAFIDQLEAPVAFWKNALMKKSSRNYLRKAKDGLNTMIIDLPSGEKGSWTKDNMELIAKARDMRSINDSVDNVIKKVSGLNSSAFDLEVYEQVNVLTRFTSDAIIALHLYDQATGADRQTALEKLRDLRPKFEVLRSELESVYSQTRVLTKPDNYILDQDHHVHLANQSTSFDWQFRVEMMFLDKLDLMLELADSQSM